CATTRRAWRRTRPSWWRAMNRCRPRARWPRPTARAAHERAPAAAADPGAAGGRGPGTDVRAPTLRHGAAADRGLDVDGPDAVGRRAAGARRRRRRGRRVPARRLARAAGHRPDGGPAGGAD